MRNVPPGIQTMFGNGGRLGSDCACLTAVIVVSSLITSSTVTFSELSDLSTELALVRCHFGAQTQPANGNRSPRRSIRYCPSLAPRHSLPWSLDPLQKSNCSRKPKTVDVFTLFLSTRGS